MSDHYKSKATAAQAASRYRNDRDRLQNELEEANQTIVSLNEQLSRSRAQRNLTHTVSAEPASSRWNWLSFFVGILAALIVPVIGFNWIGPLFGFAWDGAKILLRVAFVVGIIIGAVWVWKQIRLGFPHRSRRSSQTATTRNTRAALSSYGEPIDDDDPTDNQEPSSPDDSDQTPAPSQSWLERALRGNEPNSRTST